MTRPARATAARGALLAAITVLAATPATAPAATAPGHGCPVRLDRDGLASAATLRALTAKEWSYGPRPTGGPAHRRMVAWLERELRRVHGLRVRSRGFRIDAWAPRAARLRVHAGGRTLALPVAAPVPYARPTAPSGRRAPLAVVPAGTPITPPTPPGRSSSASPAGHGPVRRSSGPARGLDRAVRPRPHDRPGRELRGRLHRLRRARARPARRRGGRREGHPLRQGPAARQLAGHYEPYEGAAWRRARRVPRRRRGARRSPTRCAAATGARRADPRARALRRSPRRRCWRRCPGAARSASSSTATPTARTPSRTTARSRWSRCRATSRACRWSAARARSSSRSRPRTSTSASPSRDVRDGGAGAARRAARPGLRQGHGPAVVVLEHLGAREYQPVPRAGGPGRVLRPTGRARDPVHRDRRARARAAVDVGRAPRPGAHDPAAGSDGRARQRRQHCNFGGEGTPYDEHLLPTVGVISAPRRSTTPRSGSPRSTSRACGPRRSPSATSRSSSPGCRPA